VQLGGGGGGGGGGGAAWVTVNVWPAMVIVPVRTAAVFAATVKLTDPLPVPAAPAVIVIHDALLTAVHAHVPPAVTVIAVPGPPASAIDSLAGAIVLVQLGAVGGAGAGGIGGCDASCCVMVCVRSAMVTVPVRDGPLLASMRNATAPLPLPWAPDAIVIHDALLVAVHVQPFDADTATLAVTELELIVWASGASVTRQVAASCITRMRLSLTTISPSRIEGVGFGAARNATLPLPWPEVGEISVTQLGWLETVHSHSGWAAIAMVPVPPPATMFEGCAAVIWHFVDVGPVVTDDVLAELHAATHNASTAIGTNAGEYLRGISVFSSTTRAGSALCIRCASDLTRYCSCARCHHLRSSRS
jgi:hypothetical protein